MIKTRWFIYTVLVGMIPFGVRLIIYFVSLKDLTTAFIISESDLITLGLVLNLSNINEIEGHSSSFGDSKLLHIGFSVLLLILLSVMFGAAIINTEVVSTKFLSSYKLKISAGIVCLASLALGYATFDRIKKLNLLDSRQNAA